MKKFIQFIFLIIAIPAFSQFSLTMGGNPVENGSVIGVNTADYPASEKSLYITNTSSSSISVRLKVMSFSNTDGSSLQICVGINCYMGVTTGQMFPPSGPINLATAAQSNIKIANFDGGTSYPMDYNLRVYQVDGSGNEIGTPINFTYRFDPSLSAQNFDTLKNIGIQIENTLVSQDFKILATQNTTVAVYDINGRALVQSNLKVGENVINVQNLTSGMYVASFSTEDGKTATAKIMVK